MKDYLRAGNALMNIGRTYILVERYKDASTALAESIDIYEKHLRGGLMDDINKISIFDTYSGSYNLLQLAFAAQNQFGQALEVAEQSRASAFVELMASKQSKKLIKPLTITTPKLVDIQRIAQQQNATLVEYSLISDIIFIWVISPSGEIAFRQVNLSQIDVPLSELVRNSRNGIGARGRIPRASAQVVLQPRQEKDLQTLHQLLIEPISSLLPKDQNQPIIFIPQGELFLVPFPALKDARGQYLIDRHTILTSPSIQVLEQTQQRRKILQQQWANKTVSPALVVGNPAMPKIKLGDQTEILKSLPGAATEGKEIATILTSTMLTGHQATKSKVVEQMKDARFVHLATHGLLDDFRGFGIPGAIALAPDQPGQENSGLLTADEISTLSLNAELAVLSACDTGRGTITGDGVVGLSRSLIVAGVPSVVVSLWKVSDESTAMLMTEFYQNLQRKSTKAQALRKAILKTKKTYADPYYWAAFTLIGEAE
nr:CHAT domain-containing protein [Leptolyngbya boryana]